MSSRRGSPSRATSAITAAPTAARKASASRALPRLAIRFGRELRGALRDQRFRLPDESAVLEAAGEDDLAAAPERVRHGPLVGHRQALALAVAVDHPEGDPVALVADRAFDDPAGHLVAGAGTGGEQLRGLLRLGRSR